MNFQVNAEGRVVGLSIEPDPLFPHHSENVPENFRDYIYVNGDFIYSESQDSVKEREDMDRQEVMDSLPDALADLSMAVSDGATDTEMLANAIAELSEIVSGLVEGA